MDEAFDLDRFVKAQQHSYPTVLKELREGQKKSHWMWYIFPQIAGLGKSATALTYALSSRAEAKAYRQHSILSSRLNECTQLVLNIEGRSIEAIFPYSDHLKFHSSMTLFDLTSGPNEIFWAAIERYFEGVPDQRTMELVNSA